MMGRVRSEGQSGDLDMFADRAAQVQHVRRYCMTLGDIDEELRIGELLLANSATCQHRRRIVSSCFHEIDVKA